MGRVIDEKAKKLGIIAAATLLAAAIACSATESEPEPTQVAVFSETIISRLEAEGFEFSGPESTEEPPFMYMHGLLSSSAYVNETGHDMVWAHDFIGDAEARVAATRVSPGLASIDVPSNQVTGDWIQTVNYAPHLLHQSGFGSSAQIDLFVDSGTIVVYLGQTQELRLAIEEEMGSPFAGLPVGIDWIDRTDADPYAMDHPKLRDIWHAEPVQYRNIEIRLQDSSIPGEMEIRVDFESRIAYSSACGRRPTQALETVGDDHMIMYFNVLADTQLLQFAEECVIRWEWVQDGVRFNDVNPELSHSVIFNGRVLGSVSRDESFLAIE